MPFICKCQKLYNDKTFKFELHFDFYKSSTDCHLHNHTASDVEIRHEKSQFTHHRLKP